MTGQIITVSPTADQYTLTTIDINGCDAGLLDIR